MLLGMYERQPISRGIGVVTCPRHVGSSGYAQVHGRVLFIPEVCWERE